jgi:phage shock protein PspC (stress-responsive transcriptional regulator)
MWNFVGRQDDVQSQGGIENGNWISGIKPIDAIFLGNQNDLTDDAKNHPSRNTYYFLPLILGLIGLYYQLVVKRDKRNFFVVFMLFILTGLAIVVYLNQYPLQPRERDYAYAGSFYAFTIWIGLGVLAVYEWFKKIMSETTAAGTAEFCAWLFL